MRRALISGALAIAAFGVTVPAAAQPQPPKTAPGTWSMSKDYRAVQLSALQTQRKLLLAMADSMPERHYADKATPSQRSFAEQVYHIARSAGFVASWWLEGAPRIQPGSDSTSAVADRAGLKRYVDGEYDYLEGLLTGQTDGDRDTLVQFFGGKMVPRWQVWDEMNQHAMWTAGQIVANFRKHGMAPPSFLFF